MVFRARKRNASKRNQHGSRTKASRGPALQPIESVESGPSEAQEIEALRAERMRWATRDMSLRALAEDFAELIQDMRRFEPIASATLLAGLLTEPSYQSSTLRLELLISLALVYARGVESPSELDGTRWYAMAGTSRVALGEDPAEDVFVNLIVTEREDFLLLEGLWEAAGFYTQCMLNVVESMPAVEPFQTIRARVRALLVVSDVLCKKARLERYQVGSDQVIDELDLSTLPSPEELRQRVRLSFSELNASGVQREHLFPFVLDESQWDSLPDQVPGLSDLDRCPLLMSGDGICVALPTGLSTAARDLVIDFVLESGRVDPFNIAYAQMLSHKIASTRLFGSLDGCSIQWQSAGSDQLASTTVEFDQGHFVALHFVLPSIEHHLPGRFKHFGVAAPELVEALGQAMSTARSQVEAAAGFRAALHVIVLCDWGHSTALPLKFDDRQNWEFEALTIAELIRLSNDHSMSMERFWRLHVAVRALNAAGVEIQNVNGVLNLIGWVELNGGHLIPHHDLGDGRVSSERPLLVAPPTNLLRDVRARIDRASDLHVCKDISGSPHHVARVNPHSYFNDPSGNRVYACGDCAARGELVAVCEGSPTVWLRIEAPGGLSLDTRYRLWEMLGLWAARVVVVLESAEWLDQQVELIFRFEDTQNDVEALGAKPPNSSRPPLRIEINAPSSATIIAGAGFMYAFRTPTNDAERLLVEVMLRAIHRLGGVHLIESELAVLLRGVVTNDTGRHFHLLHPQEFSDFVASRLPSKALSIDDIDRAHLRLGLGWTVHDGGNDIQGKVACCAMLNQLVASRVKRIVAQLADLNRADLIGRLLVNHEVSYGIETRWKRTSAGVLGFHGDSPETRSVVIDHLSRAASSQITSRVLIEMALCASRLEGGRVPANLEIEALLAEIELLIRLGSLSDGIYYGVLEPRVRVSPLGDVMVKDAFGKDVVGPMLSLALGERYARVASRSKQYYTAPRVVESAAKFFEAEFVAAWKAEMGFEIDDGRRIIDAIENVAIHRNSTYLSLSHSELTSALGRATDATSVERFIARFSIRTRAKWDEPPSDFKVREVLPWRFGRKLSLVTRPLIQISSDHEPMYLISPTMLRNGFFYVLSHAHMGALDQDFFESGEMRAWLGKANEGHTFNSEVAQRLVDEGWSVKENVTLPEVLQCSLERDYGDIDVLAWRDGTPVVLVVECKDLRFRRNYSEIAALLSDYRGESKSGKPDKLRRHLNRVNRLGEEPDALSRYTGIASPKIQSCLIFGETVPMQFAAVPALSDTIVGGIDDLLAGVADR